MRPRPKKKGKPVDWMKTGRTIRRNLEEHDANLAKRKILIQIRHLKNRVREKRRLLGRVAVMTIEQLLEHKRIAMSAKDIPSERKAKLAGMGPETFRKVWMAGLRKSIRELKELTPDAPDQ